jgi:hypothetical protein
MAEDLLVLNYPRLATRAEALFAALGASEELRDRFISDPAGVLTELVFPQSAPLAKADLESTNRLLLSLLVNPRFMRWAEEWQKEHAERIRTAGTGDRARVEVRLDMDEVHRELGEAMIRFGVPEAAEKFDLSGTSESAKDLPDFFLPDESNLADLSPGAQSKVVNVNVNVAVNVSVTLTGALLVVLVIPVIVLGVLDSPQIDRTDLRSTAASLLDRLERHAARIQDRGDLDSGPG